MSADRPHRPAALFAAALLGAAMLGAWAIRPASAGSQPYLGWDFGGGFGVGVGTPPSAYDPCPTYGWPVYPYRCRYYYSRHARHVRHAHHHRRYY